MAMSQGGSKEMNPFPEPPERMQPCWSICDFWSLGLWENKFVLFSSHVLGSCYSSNRKLVQGLEVWPSSKCLQSCKHYLGQCEKGDGHYLARRSDSVRMDFSCAAAAQLTYDAACGMLFVSCNALLPSPMPLLWRKPALRRLFPLCYWVGRVLGAGFNLLASGQIQWREQGVKVHKVRSLQAASSL